MKGIGRTLGSASEVSHRAVPCHSLEGLAIPIGMQQREKFLLLLCYFLFFFFLHYFSFVADPKR